MLLFQNQAKNSQKLSFTLSPNKKLIFDSKPYFINEQKANSHSFKSYSVVVVVSWGIVTRTPKSRDFN